MPYNHNAHNEYKHSAGLQRATRLPASAHMYCPLVGILDQLAAGQVAVKLMAASV
jgi:hypothetical protein